MKTEQELNADILNITLKIQNNYPELSKYIDEMPVTIPNKVHPDINITNLKSYYNSLLEMVNKYEQNSKVKSNENISSSWKLVIAILICEATGIISGLIANTNMNPWFDTLNKPSWNPPAYLFAPVWTILYLLMGISLWLVWKNKSTLQQKNNAINLFAFQLFLNFWWSIIFFKFHSPLFALVDILLLLILILFTIISFSKISKLSAWLLVPYIAWVTFAAILNYSIWVLNR